MLRPPTGIENIEDVIKYLMEIYRETQSPQLNYVNLIPRSTLSDTSEGNLYYDSDTDTVQVRDSSSFKELPKYSTGTHTVAVTCETSGTVTLNSSYDLCSYIKIGKLVFLSGYIQVSAISSPVGDLQFSMPFTADSLAEVADAWVGNVSSNINFTGNYLSIIVAGGWDYFKVREVADDAATDYIDGNDIAASDEFTFSIVYQADS